MDRSAEEYKRLVLELIAKRTTNEIDRDGERRYAGLLDEQWSLMDLSERETVDAWVRLQVKATPSSCATPALVPAESDATQTQVMDAGLELRTMIESMTKALVESDKEIAAQGVKAAERYDMLAKYHSSANKFRHVAKCASVASIVIAAMICLVYNSEAVVPLLFLTVIGSGAVWFVGDDVASPFQ